MGTPLSGRRILVVDDDEMIAELIEEMILEEGGSVVGPAHSLDRALALARDEAIDAAVLDVNLAGVRSFPVADVLRTRGIPFLFATGYGDVAISPEHAGAPMIAKPFPLDALVRRIEQLMA